MSDNKTKPNNLKHRAYYLSLEIIDLASHFPNGRVYWIIQDQLIRSITSIGANMIEAKSSSSKKEFIKFYDIALKSANESQYWMCLLKGTVSKHYSYCNSTFFAKFSKNFFALDSLKLQKLFEKFI
jgi:four helix bundle protein